MVVVKVLFYIMVGGQKSKVGNDGGPGDRKYAKFVYEISSNPQLIKWWPFPYSICEYTHQLINNGTMTVSLPHKRRLMYTAVYNFVYLYYVYASNEGPV